MPQGGLEPGQVRVTWMGHACFLLEDAEGRRVVTDPFANIGYPRPEVPADVVLVTHEHFDHNDVSSIQGSPVVIRGVGDDQRFAPRVAGAATVHRLEGAVQVSGAIAGVDFLTIPGWHDDRAGAERGAVAIYRWRMGGLTFVHLGDIGQSALTDEQREWIGAVDVLFIPVGGVYTVDATGATALAAHLAPNLTVPMHYHTPRLNIELAPVQEFLMGKQFWTAPGASVVLAMGADGEVQVMGDSAPPHLPPVLVFPAPGG